MKKLFLLAMALVLLMCLNCACAENFEIDTGRKMIYRVETFGAELPRELQPAMAETPFAGDRLLCGVIMDYVQTSSGRADYRTALIAVEHQGRRLLLGAQNLQDTGWRIRLESETFLRDEDDFTLTVVQARVVQGGLQGTPWGTEALPAVVYGNEAYMLKPMFGAEVYSGLLNAQWFNLYSYMNLDANGDGLTITRGLDSYPWTAERHQGGESTKLGEWYVRWPGRTEFLDGDTFPRTEQELAAWAAANPMDEASAWVFAANLRTSASTSSKSQGKYIYAPLKVIGQRSGSSGPWYQVRVGDTEGWISTPYVSFKGSDSDDMNLYLCQTSVPPVAKANGETALCTKPEGKRISSLPAGTGMQILAEAGEWLHVQIPHGELGWRSDVAADYGYVRKSEVTVYDSPLNMKYDLSVQKVEQAYPAAKEYFRK